MTESSPGEFDLVEEPDGVVVSVRVQPGARRTEVAGRLGGALRVRLAAPAHDGLANEALITFMASLFELRPRQVSIRSGGASRHKRLTLRGISSDQARSVLERATVAS